MTKEEYFIQLSKIDDAVDIVKNKLAKEFALTNNSTKIGDIISDHIGSIRVVEIKVSLISSNSLPCCLAACVKVIALPKAEKYQNCGKDA